MKYIKVFEEFDEDYIKSSIDDIFVELKDEGMLVKTYHFVPTNGIVKKESYSVVIKGELPNDNSSYIKRTFETSYIQSYVDTLIDFMSEFCPDFDYHFEEYDRWDNVLWYTTPTVEREREGEEMSGREVGSVVIVFVKRRK